MLERVGGRSFLVQLCFATGSPAGAGDRVTRSRTVCVDTKVAITNTLLGWSTPGTGLGELGDG